MQKALDRPAPLPQRSCGFSATLTVIQSAELLLNASFIDLALERIAVNAVDLQSPDLYYYGGYASKNGRRYYTDGSGRAAAANSGG